jgi:hypothetical protein
MGEEIIMSIPGSWYFWIPLAIGIVSLIAAIAAAFKWGDLSWNHCDCKKAINAFIAFLVFGLLCTMIATPWVGHNYDDPISQVNYEMVYSELQPIQEVYQTNPFYLKESVSEMGIRGELKGKVGGFLFVGGNIYGHIDSGRVITVVYEDNDPLIDHYTNVHRAISFPLDEAVIVTIPAGERPYLMYPEAKILEESREWGMDENVVNKLRLVPGTPHLYLPKGWKIL